MSDIDVRESLPKIVAVILNLFRFMALVGFVYFVIGLGVAVRNDYPLWVSPSYAEGTIIGHTQTSWQSSSSQGSHTTTAQLPVVEFRTVAGVPVVFTGNIGDRSISQTVRIIYSQEDPRNARVDNGLLWNWIEVYLFLFGAVACLLGMVRFTKTNIASMLRKAADEKA
jgi:hypothetical protein